MRMKQLRAIVVIFKLTTGIPEILLGLSLLLVSSGRLGELAESIAGAEFVEDPTDRIARMIGLWLPSLLAHKNLVGLGFLALGSTKVAGALGLLLHKPWAYYLLVFVAVLLLPLEIRELLSHFSAFKAGFTVLNLAVLALLFRYRRELVAFDE